MGNSKGGSGFYIGFSIGPQKFFPAEADGNSKGGTVRGVGHGSVGGGRPRSFKEAIRCKREEPNGNWFFSNHQWGGPDLPSDVLSKPGRITPWQREVQWGRILSMLTWNLTSA